MHTASSPPIVVPVADIDRALGLYRDCLGFVVLSDHGWPPGRQVP